MNCNDCEIKQILTFILLKTDSCIHCKHHNFDKYQCNDCKYIDSCKDYNMYELDIDKVKADYNLL